MHILTATKARVELDLVAELPLPAAARPAAAERRTTVEEEPVHKAARAFFELNREVGNIQRRVVEVGAPPAVFRERETGLVRTVYREIALRFRPRTPERRRRAILETERLERRRTNPFVPDQVIVAPTERRRGGAELVDVANRLAEMEEVVFAAPNFVSEYRRQAAPLIPTEQWALRNRGKSPGQVKGEDVDALGAWRITRGKRSIVVAILDDGVDIDHPNLKSRVWRNRDGAARDQVGRDFFVPDDHPEHYDPRPKKFRFPYDQLRGNDIHGTPCAGVVAAAGKGAWGIAPGCRILAVKIFHGDELAADERVANAIRYAAGLADILSCSWTGGMSPDVELAIVDAGRGRGGLGSAVFCAAGNEYGDPVGYPASDPNTIAVGASTDMATIADYSNVGPEIDFVAPSSGGVRGIFTTDVSYPNRGFNLGRADQGGADGLHTNSFGGTSSATPLAAGIGALVLSVRPDLSREDLRQLLRATAEKIGSGYDPATGHSPEYGYGRVNAARAVAAAKTWGRAVAAGRAAA